MEKIDVLDKGFVRLVRSMGDDAAIVQCARTSYGAGTKTVSEDRGLIRTLMRERHTSPFECVHFTFHVRAPIFVFRQWHRHRMWSYNELSGRYSEMPEDCYVPKEEHVTKQDPVNKQGGTIEQVEIKRSEECPLGLIFDSWGESFEHTQSEIKSFYNEYLKTGMRRELARINLPLSQYSEMYATCDLHNILHFLKLRLDKHAQYEIRVYAEAMLEIMRPIVPVTIEAFEDYILDSMTFSKKEQLLLAGMMIESLRDKFVNPDVLEKYIESESGIDSKRERQALFGKLKTISEMWEKEQSE